MKVAVLCGGPSLERGISLNSARSVLDHLSSDQIEIVPIYFDVTGKAYHISCSQLYSNTPSDFDFKLKQTAKPLTQKSLITLLKTVDIAFPAMHGPFGEDGGVQTLLEHNGIPFIGSGSEACQLAFDKYISNEHIAEAGFFTLPSLLIEPQDTQIKKKLTAFFKQHQIERAIVKPASGGSSIGVYSVSTVADAMERIAFLFEQRMDARLVVEPFAQGVEFTVIILENRFGLPVALPPTEIETDYTEHQILDFRKKYLPTRQVIWHCPPRFEDKVIEKIQAQAEQLFALFGMHDFARFDGWVMPDGNIWFCDFNPISGMEQNSFLFQQSSRIGFTHAGVLRHVLQTACAGYDIPFPVPKPKTKQQPRKQVNVLFGGQTSERQVSLMSGTNVWLKLRGSEAYQPQPYLLDMEGNVWHLPYHLALNHTVEEITENCKNYPQAKQRLQSFEQRTRIRLGLLDQKDPIEFFEPKRMTLNEFIKQSEFVFIGLHGGFGEDGTLQGMLSKQKVLFNGSNEKISALCMDKFATATAIRRLKLNGVDAIINRAMDTADLLTLNDTGIKKLWAALQTELATSTMIVKPRADGCSTGVIHIYSAQDLQSYVNLLRLKATFVPKDTFPHQPLIIEMPLQAPKSVLFERFIETDVLHVKNNQLHHQAKTGWVEITIGVIMQNGKLHALNPSITIAEGEVLSVEEKFQGGTGVNITPPPAELVDAKTLQKIKTNIETLATNIGIEGYSRIDAFIHLKTGELQIIEINTLPGLTPSTVLYHQGLAEKSILFPQQLLEQLVKNKGY